MMHIRCFAFAKLTLVALLTICFTFAIGFLNAAPELAMAGGAQGVPSVVGQWSPVFNWGVPDSPTTPPSVAIHTSVLPNGKVLTWQRVDTLLSTDTYLWDPTTNAFMKFNNPNSHMFCSGHSFLPDGRLLVAGGHRIHDGDGEWRTNIFDYTTNTWTPSGDMKTPSGMNRGRWYPTNTTLGNGEVLTVSGLYWDDTYNPLMTTVTCDNSYDLYFDGVYRGSGSNWMQAQTYNLPQHAGKNVIAIKCMDVDGVAGLLADIQISDVRTGSNGSKTWKVSLTAPANWADPNFNDSGWADATDYGAYGVGPWGTNVAGMPSNTPGRWIWSSNNDLHDVVYIRGTFDGNSSVAHHHLNNTLPQVWQPSGTWRSLTSANRDLPLYPWMLLGPDGRVFYAGPDPVTRFLDTTGAGSWSADLPALPNSVFRDYGSAVMYDVGKVLITGGGPPTNTTQVINIDPASGPPAWRYVGSMAYPRRQMNATVLPDGKVLATGGTTSAGFNDATGSVLAAEMWDPGSETWTTMASMQERRLYHSTAVLLKDGRVLSLGGGQPAGGAGDSDHMTAEIYSPPYLFKGARPTITSAPTSASYGQTFFVQTPDVASISKVTLVRLSSVTHSFNENQRFISINPPDFTKVAGGLNVTAPANGNVCPPGHYMMFILNGNLVPSVASIIRINADSTGSSTNVALASNGGVASASSTFSSGFPPGGANNGDRRGLNWESGGGWNDATPDAYPDWIQIDFNGSKTINRIDVFTTQDNYTNPAVPTQSMTFSLYGITDYQVQYWNGAAWLTVPSGSVSGNNLIWRQFNFSPITTTRIRVLISASLASFSRVVEIEAWQSGSPPPSPPPSVTTGAASSIGQNTATLNATVNPNGAATTCFFQWGTTTSYGNTTPQISAGSGTSPVSIGANLTGLSANTTYHFRIVANNANGNSVGSDSAFTTTTASPSYEGFIDIADCNSIVGWAADRNRLNTSITVSIFDGATFVSTVLADQLRSDVGNYLGDNGRHGFAITTPAHFKDGLQHTLRVKFESTSIELGGSPRTIVCPSGGSANIAWIKPSEFSWGPPNTMTVAGFAQNGSGGVQLVWRDVTINGPENVVSWQPTPNPADNSWSNTIPSSNRCHTYSAYVNYSGFRSPDFTYNGLNSGYCNESARVIWIQPQTTAGFGPPGSLVVAGSATNAPSGTQVYLWYRNVTAGTGWTRLDFAPPPGSDGIWYNSIPNANFSHQYQVYVIYDVFTSSICTYSGNNSISWCP